MWIEYAITLIIIHRSFENLFVSQFFGYTHISNILLHFLKIISIITLAEKGSLIVTDDKVLKIYADPVSKVIDTTGAGDLFAAGFLFGMTHQKNLEESGYLASIAASEIISHFGVRPQVKLSSLI